ncbi:prenyltransferase/squalene oxidase repeat-containing protein [Actinoplanes sp. DH11]|uniref:prenyltransferase/squalene oxidase repeat-containing protein n=1 Tax=Actinoplanes sp. DH11 TaxID=2857011 RepID=UPI001E4DF020|nr:prenyltransferase/squalene oxidase repeat-containing protein [Actinoplanes sp. DH11]
MNPGQLSSGTGQAGAELALAAAALRDRAVRVQSAFAAVAYPNSTESGPDTSLLRILTDALSSQHPDGSWGSDDAPRQKPCFTAQTIIMLDRIGITYHKPADGRVEALGPGHAVQQAVRWLESVQRPDGGWGEDIWDGCQVLLALHLCGYRAGDPCVDRALRLLRSHVGQNWPDRTSYWFGPSFHGAAMEVFNRYDDPAFAGRARNQIWEFWDEDAACFRSPDESNGQHAPAEWQTACAISGLRSFGTVSPTPERVDRASAWLVKTQSTEGSWGPMHREITGYCSLRAILALNRSGYPGNRDAALKGTQWFVEQYSHDGPLTVKLMAAAAVAHTRHDELVAQLSFYWMEEIGDLLDRYRSLADALGEQVQRSAGELADAQQH